MKNKKVPLQEKIPFSTKKTFAQSLDLSTIGGLLCGILAICIAFTLEGGKAQALFHIPAILIVIGGTLGATTVGISFNDFLSIPQTLQKAFISNFPDYKDTVETTLNLAKMVRKGGILAIEDEIEKIKYPLLKKGLSMALLGVEPSKILETMGKNITNIEERQKKEIGIFRRMGGFSPTMGIIGTVLGLIYALGNLKDPDKIAESIAGAFIATLWGIFMANIIYLPIANKIEFLAKQENLIHSIIMDSITDIQLGTNPAIIEEKLGIYLEEEKRNREVTHQKNTRSRRRES